MIQHHKRLSLDLDRLLPAGGTSQAAPHDALPRLRKLPGSTADLDAAERGDWHSGSEGADGGRYDVTVDGHEARLLLSDGGAAVRYAEQRGRCCSSPPANERVPYSEMLSARVLEPRRGARGSAARLEVFTFRRVAAQPCAWAPRRMVVEARSSEEARAAAAALTSGIDSAAVGRRPRRLLVIINPKAGRRQAPQMYRRIVAPVLQAAGIAATVRLTESAGHAGGLARSLALEQAQRLDGIVAVGGDGVFHEVINGLLAARAAAPSVALASALARLRLAHVPAGSTDAVACTLHGCRSVFTAAMHVALGDRTSLDVLRVDLPSGPVFSTCIAAWGFMGDVMAASERLRWLGPARYDLVGAAALLANRSYPAKIWYVQGAGASELASHPHGVCRSNCQLCRTAGELRHSASGRKLRPPEPGAAATGLAAAAGGAATPPEERAGGSDGAAAAALAPGVYAVEGADADFTLHASTAGDRHAEGWRLVEGRFLSVMLIVMPCLSDKTRHGMARYGHLSDGRLKLVLVRQCSPVAYLRFLAGMSASGVFPGQHEAVEVLDAAAVRFEGAGSAWNLDGELARASSLAAEMHLGLVEVFARGIER